MLVRAAQRVVVGHFLQTDIEAPVGAILQERHHPAITLLLMLPQHQARKELWPGEILAAELGLVRLQACAVAEQMAALNTFRGDLQVSIL